ncbi:MAG: EutP/PduV family microcompartment system protein [Clostridia bacterium]|nr:EutP/PduV family microcompartment system protein [Clostridia bacterium]
MKKIILIGRSGAGKTTLKQALRKEKIEYKKTQYIDWNSWIIDTPGEYVENKNLSCALGLYAYEADVVGLLLSADDSFSVYSPNMTGLVNREVIGIVTKSDLDNPIKAKEWLKLAGCERIFVVNSINGDGIEQLINYLSE